MLPTGRLFVAVLPDYLPCHSASLPPGTAELPSLHQVQVIATLSNCKQAASQYGVKLLAYGTLAGGLLSDRFYEAPASK